MNKDQARNFVKQTFTHPFDKTRFLDFAKNLVNHLDESKAASMQVPNAFKAHVRSCTRLGTYRSPRGELADVLIVNTTGPEKIERTRTALRDFVAHKLKREEDYKEAGIVAFVSPDERNWRFSYIRMEYQSKRNPDTGKIVAEERVTPARRFSYIVGEGESCHTAQARFLNLLQDTEHDPTLSEIEEAFSVEVVTKEFFTQYVKLFERINESLEKLAKKDKSVAEEFKTKGITTVDFAKKLMGQIVFLYFLQKKGWLGVDKGKQWGTGPRSFLRLLADRKYSTYDNFFNDVLEPLFYDTLATDRGYEAWCEQFNCRIPFLNGGLFEPPANYNWKNIDITLPNGLFTNDDYIDVGVSGTGVLDVFDRYNFTVNEAEPLETEVAIDPEMLGKVFENLIEENRRKGLGAFYTPREIVHYMCQESLINYLDNALNQAISKPMVPENAQQQQLFGKSKIPFAGKNPQQAALARRDRAVLIPREDIETFIRLGEQISHYESVETTYKIRMPKSIKDHARLIDEKLRDITVCDPAVGSAAFLVMMMMQIVRARVALTPYFTDVNERTPYHFKRHAILNSLYGVDVDAGAVEIAKLRLWLSLVVDEEDVKQIKPLPNLDYRVIEGNSLIGLPDGVLRDAQIESELELLRRKLGDETDNERKRQYREEIKKRVQPLLDSAEHYAGYKANFDFRLFFSEVFHGKDGFDIVIANPPYISHDKIDITKAFLKNTFRSYEPFADIYCYFIEKGLDLQNSRGVLTFITSNSYLRADYGLPLRKFLRKENEVISIVNLEDAQVFESAIVNVAILITSKSLTASKCFVFNKPVISPIPNFVEYVATNGFHYDQAFLDSKSWSLIPPGKIHLQKKIEGGHKTLEQLGAKIRLGLATGNNDAFIIDENQRKDFIKSDRKNAEIIKPILRGRDIFRFRYDSPNSYILLTKNGIDVKKDYPDIYKYLDGFGRSFKNRGAQGQHWTNLRAVAFFDDFKKPKIVWIELTDTGRFALCAEEIYLLNSAYFMLPPPEANIRYLLGILNSELIHFYLGLIAETSGMGTSRWINNHVKDFPIPQTTIDQQKPIVTLVDRITTAKRRNPDADASAMEREIDQLVYQLYGLTEEEIKIVENV